jgi:phosphatidylglycerophosphate synthase
MRKADLATILRVLLVFLVAYLVILKINPIYSILILIIAFLLDGVDGYLAIREASSNKISFLMYIKTVKGDSKYRKEIKELKESISKKYPHGPRMDVAGDRAVEYALWAVFTYLNILPLFIILIVIFRHSFVDGLMAAKGTSNKMKSKLAKIIYSSNISRGGVNVVKFVTFSYLILVYTSKFPIIYGYILTGILLLYIILRGVAEVYEVFQNE